MTAAAGWHLPHVATLRELDQLVGLAEGRWLMQYDPPVRDRLVWVPGKGVYRQGRKTRVAPGRLEQSPWLVAFFVSSGRPRVLDVAVAGDFRARTAAILDRCPGVDVHFRYLDGVWDVVDATRRVDRLFFKRWAATFVPSRVAPVYWFGAFRARSAAVRRLCERSISK